MFRRQICWQNVITTHVELFYSLNLVHSPWATSLVSVLQDWPEVYSMSTETGISRRTTIWTYWAVKFCNLNGWELYTLSWKCHKCCGLPQKYVSLSYCNNKTWCCKPWIYTKTNNWASSVLSTIYWLLKN
jgi:hypothetical protein